MLHLASPHHRVGIIYTKLKITVATLPIMALYKLSLKFFNWSVLRYHLHPNTCIEGMKESREIIKSIIFWDMTPCRPLSSNRRFGGTYRLYLQGRRNRFSKPASKQVASTKSYKILKISDLRT
jgi:hypothetical protein